MIMSAHMGACPSGLAMSALTVMASAIPDRVRLQVKEHDEYWAEPARLWTVLVGGPSTKKSPILSAAIRPLASMDNALVKDWQERLKAWNALSKEERLLIPEPLQRRYRIQDTTVEAAQEVLKGSTQGILCTQDELSGWFGAMEKYASAKGSSADRSFWLQAHNGGPYSLNRIGRGVSVIENLSISLLGGIQPEPIRKIASASQDDGLLQRMHPIILTPATVGTDSPIPPIQNAYNDTVKMLTLVCVLNGNLRFDKEALTVRMNLEKKHISLQSVETLSSLFSSHVGKLDGIFARLCVIWHAVENCHNFVLPNVVSYHTAQRVATFMDKFLLPHAACFYKSLGLGDKHDALEKVALQILAKKLQQVTVRDIGRATRALRDLESKDVLPILQQLVALNWLAEKPGPRATSDPTFIVNPCVHHLYAARGEAELARRENAKSIMQEYFSTTNNR